jgi:hypothetical protein
MIYYVLDSPLIPLIVLVASFLIMRMFTSRMQVNELDSLGQLNVNTAFSISSLTALAVLGYVQDTEFLSIGFLYLLFYMVMWFASMAMMNRKMIAKQDFGYDPQLFADLRYQYIVATVTGVILAVTSLFFSYILVSNGLSGDDRIAIAKDFRFLDVIRRGFATVFTYYSISCFLYRRDRYLLALLIFNILIGFFSGSKGFFAEYLTAYITLESLIKGRRQIDLKKYLPLIAVVLAFTIGTVMFWQNVSFVDALVSFSNRLFASGDIFYYSFVYNNYQDLYGEYNFWSYVFHPFTSLIGIRGYEWPIGSLLYAQAGSTIQGFGPNPQLPMTAIILNQGNFWLSAVFCAFMAVVVVVARNFALRLLEVRSLPTVLRTSIFALCFVKSPVVLVDFSLFAIDLIAVAIMTAVTLGFQGILDRRDLVLARRAERLQKLAGKKVQPPAPDSPPPEQVTPEIPLTATRSKKADQFEEFITTTILRNDRLKKLAELLNITTKLK